MCTKVIVHLVSNLFGQEILLKQFVAYFDFLKAKCMKWGVACEGERKLTPSIPEYDSSIFLAGSAKKFGMSGIPRYIIDIVNMSTSE
jgi:hypothetical protein